MNTALLESEFYQCIKKALESFSKSSDNDKIYAMVLDCDSDVGMVSLRYGNAKHFQENLKNYETYRQKYGWAVYGLHGSEYDPGEFQFIDFQMPEVVKHFTDSYYYHSVGDYFGEGEPIEDIKENYKEIFWTMIVDTINRLKEEVKELAIDVTDDFIFFHCDHDQSYEERDRMIAMTVDKPLMDKLINKNNL